MSLSDVLFRIQKRLEKLNLAESKAAVMAGLSESAIRNWRRNIDAGNLKASPNLRSIERLAPVLQTTSAWLLEARGPEELGGDYVSQTTILDIPLISWENAAKLGLSGAPVLAKDTLRILPAVDLDPHGDWIALRVYGDDMDLKSPPDSIIFVNRRDRKPEPFKYYVIINGNRTLYRRFCPPHIWEPVSQNTQHKPLVLTNDNAPVIIGRVGKSSMRDM